MVEVTHQARKIWTYDRTTVQPTVQGATFNMRGQLYRGHTNATALSSSPVVSAPGSESDDSGSSPGRGEALSPWDMREKKMRAPPLGLAKSIHYFTSLGKKPRVEEQVIIYLSERGMGWGVEDVRGNGGEISRRQQSIKN